MSGVASLPMYWRRENADLWQRFWALVQAQGVGLALPVLTPPEDIPQPWSDHWLRPDLALSMTCGLPFRTVLRDQVTYVGTLDFGLQAPAGRYYSQIISAQDADLGGGPLRLAYNSGDSQSGWAASQGAETVHGPLAFSDMIETGSHAGSLAAVAEGRADVAFVDAVTWRILQHFDPNAGAVRVIGQTRPTPGLPLITALGRDPEPLRTAVREAILALEAEDPAAIGGPTSLSMLDVRAYTDQPIPDPPKA